MKDQRIRYVRVTHEAVDHYAKFLSLPQVIIIGDFNSNTIWDRLHRTRSHSGLVEKLESLGLVSVYHTLRGEIQGQEVGYKVKLIVRNFWQLFSQIFGETLLIVRNIWRNRTGIIS